MEKIITTIGSCLLKRSARRTLAISVLPDGRVEVIAPLNSSIPQIQKKVEKRVGWINRQRRYFITLHACRPEPRYCSGATHRYLGRQYQLKVAKAEKPSIRFRGVYLCVGTRSVSSKAVKAALSSWFRKQAKEQFIRRMGKWMEWCLKQGLPEPKVRLLNMPKRWGSTRSGGRMFLNPELVHVPSACIDYVITHEICHLKHPKHDRGFYLELSKLCPRWKELKHRLETSEL